MKRITSIITLLSLFFVMCFPSLANSSSSENSFKDYMYDIYIDPSSYTLTNSNGEDITNSFIENTRGFFISNNCFVEILNIGTLLTCFTSSLLFQS